MHPYANTQHPSYNFDFALSNQVHISGSQNLFITEAGWSNAVRSTDNSPNALYDRYRQDRIVEWSKPDYTIDKHFVRLILLKEQTEGIRFVEPVEARSYNDLRDVLRDTPDAASLALRYQQAGKLPVAV